MIDIIIAISYRLIMKTVRFTKPAEKSLNRMQPKRKAAIIAKVEAYARGELVDIKKLTNSEFYRIRVGGDRVIIDEQGMIIMVIEVGPRGGIYKDKD
jgi:mRNA interferase RelE/StbE